MPGILDLVDGAHLDATIRAGVDWLLNSEQPPQAVTQHHGISAGLGHGITVSFAPTGPHDVLPGESSVVAVNAGWVPNEERQPGQDPWRVLTEDDIARIDAAIECAGADLVQRWNGVDAQTGSWQIAGLSASLHEAVKRYGRGCPKHFGSVFCSADGCSWYSDGNALIVRPTFPQLVEAPDAG